MTAYCQLERTHVVVLHGELDVADVAQLRESLGAVPWHRAISIDLADVSFLDASVLGVLAQANARTGRLRVQGANDWIAKVFRLMGMEHMLAS